MYSSLFLALSRAWPSFILVFSLHLPELMAQPLGVDSLVLNTLEGKHKPKIQKDSIRGWAWGGGLGLDFSQLLLLNPRAGAGENRLGIGGNSSFFLRYLKRRWFWRNEARLQFAVQRLGRGNRPFQKNLDELRLSSAAYYALGDSIPFAYAFDLTFLSQLTPTYPGNLLSVSDSMPERYPLSRFLAPATLNIAPGLAYKPKEGFVLLLAPASIKMITVQDDSIARRLAPGSRRAFHGNPYGVYADEAAFRRDWSVRGRQINDSTFYASTAFQFGATLKASYQGKFFKNLEGKPLLGLQSSLLLYSNYLREPQNIDLDWTGTLDLAIIRGLSLSLTFNVFYDHDVFVLLDRDNDLSTGVNGYESTGRRVSYTQSILLKYNVLF